MTLTDRLSWSTFILGPAIATFAAQVFGISLFARQLKEAFFPRQDPGSGISRVTRYR